MADFRMLSSQIHLSYIDDEETFALDPGCSGDLALWGGGPNGETLDVRVEDTSDTAISSAVRRELASTAQAMGGRFVVTTGEDFRAQLRA